MLVGANDPQVPILSSYASLSVLSYTIGHQSRKVSQESKRGEGVSGRQVVNIVEERFE